MKSFLTLAAVATFALVGCSSKDKKQETPQPPTAAEQAKSQLDAGQATYVSQTEKRIGEMTKFSGDLRSASAKTTDKVRAKKMQNAADDLDSLLKDAGTSLNEVKTSTPENWVVFKRDVDKVMTRAETQFSNSVTLMQ